MNNAVLHKAADRGGANHGWLQARHSFSFANFYDSNRIHFGALRVLNDDIIAPGMGFGTHPHDNMEIITIPLEGDLEHRDSMGNTAVIRNGDVQVMSAGTGITHSEYNKNKDQYLKLLQIWVFPNKRNVTPRYGEKTLNLAERHNRLQTIVSPDGANDSLWIHQNAWFSMTRLDAGKTVDYTINAKENGVYAFVISGTATVNGQSLEPRDALGVWDVAQLHIEASGEAEILLLEVPMALPR
jgi:quercetin 2,3-dioxygenase